MTEGTASGEATKLSRGQSRQREKSEVRHGYNLLILFIIPAKGPTLLAVCSVAANLERLVIQFDSISPRRLVKTGALTGVCTLVHDQKRPQL